MVSFTKCIPHTSGVAGGLCKSVKFDQLPPPPKKNPDYAAATYIVKCEKCIYYSTTRNNKNGRS